MGNCGSIWLVPASQNLQLQVLLIAQSICATLIDPLAVRLRELATRLICVLRLDSDPASNLTRSVATPYLACSSLTPRLDLGDAGIRRCSAALTSTRMACVLIGENVNLRHTRLLPVTLPPGTSTQLLPVKYCTWKLVRPYCVKVIVGVGIAGAA